MSKVKKIQRAAEWFINECAKEGIVVMRYDAYSSDSVYLKLDDGVLGTIRISDHKGKKHLKYKYNLILGSPRKRTVENGTKRLYVPFQDIALLWEAIQRDKASLVRRHGEMYEQYMKKNREMADRSKGFWAKAKYV